MTAAELATARQALPGPAAAPPPARVQLDRLKWSPDGNQLAVEARCLDGAAASIDTLLVDTAAGRLIPAAPQPLAFALSADGERLAIASRYALWAGAAGRPEELVPLLRLDPTRDRVERLGFNAAGDTLLAALRRDGSDWIDLARLPLDGTRQGPGLRVAGVAAADLAWRGQRAIEPALVQPNPLPGLYQAVREDLFFIERTELATPNGGAQWFFDLHHRDQRDGSERILAKRVAPFELLVSPDSMWVALAGAEYRADYGGSVSRTLWIASPDGQEFFSVQPLGERNASVPVLAMTWRAGRLWYLTSEGLWLVSPAEGRGRRLAVGPTVPAWARELPSPTRMLTCVLPEVHADSTGAVRQRDGLRRESLPAWVMGPAGGPFRVAVGAARDSLTLRTLLTPPGGRPLPDDFPTEWRLAAAEGLPLAYGSVRDPGGTREAWLTAVGPPGALAGELWLSERLGARRVRLLKAMAGTP